MTPTHLYRPLSTRPDIQIQPANVNQESSVVIVTRSINALALLLFEVFWRILEVMPYIPSSMPTFLHHGFMSSFSANISSKSPTCLRSLTSLVNWPVSLSRIALAANSEELPRANPWERAIISLDVRPSLMTGNCYCRGSEELLRRLRWRYTSVPYL
jgi:hypothetical protein